MKNATIVLTGVALLAMAQAAQAAAPKVSGKYALMIFTQCQAGFTTTTNGTAITSLTPAGNGELNISVGTITFPTPAVPTGTATFEAYIVSGASLRINGAGSAMGVHLENATGTFSFPTATTFRFTPTGEAANTWTIRPGNTVSGVARTLYMVRRENAKCVNAVTATKQ